MSNVLSETKQSQVVALGRLGWTARRIEEETGVRRETVGKYLRAAGVPMRPPRGRRIPDPASPDEVITDPGAAKAASPEGVITDSAPKPASPEGVITDPGRVPPRSTTTSASEPYREQIAAALEIGRNATSIWQELVDRHGFSTGYASVMRFARRLRGESGREAHPVIITGPGEESQVDYGEGPMVRHPDTGKYKRTRLFLMTLGYSRKAVRLLTFRSSAEIWAKLHEEAFRRLGGATRVVVLDNLKEGVLKPDVYDPALNPLYRDVLGHYGVVALPCRVRHPDRKGKVESDVGHTQRTALKGQRFETLDEAQAHLDRWSERWADTRIHGTTKRQVSAMYAEERPHLQPLPALPFRYYRFGERTVHVDGAVEVDRAYYGAPPGWIGRKVIVQWDSICVRLIDPRSHALLREHTRQKPGGYRVRDEDRPARTPRTTLQLLERARVAGTAIGELCARVHAQYGETGVRGILGVLSLVRKHGPDQTDRACAAALEAGAPTYRCVRAYLDRFAEPPISVRQVDPLIRELTHYRDVVQRMTSHQEESP
jgi:transposase